MKNIFKKIEGQGEDVVLIHGGGGCTHQHMQPIADLLSSRYRVTSIDLPGAGDSPWQPHIKTVQDFADVLMPNLPERATYIGWSFGGQVSIAIAAKYSHRVKQLVGIATSPKFVAEDDWHGVPQPGFKTAYSQIGEIGFYPFFKSLYEAEFSEFNPKPEAYHRLIHLIDENSKMDKDLLMAWVDMCDRADLRKELASIPFVLEPAKLSAIY